MKTALLLSSLLLATCSASASTLITTPGTAGIGTLGAANTGMTPSYGNLISAPSATNNVLESYTAYFDNSGKTAQAFQFYVYSWDGTSTTGAALYTSAVQYMVASGCAFAPVTLSNIGVSMALGSTYALVFSTLGDGGTANGITEAVNLVGTSSNGFIYNNNGSANKTSTVQSLTSGGWTNYGTTNKVQAEYVALFDSGVTPSATPEPGSFVLLGTGMLSAAWMQRRRFLGAV